MTASPRGKRPAVSVVLILLAAIALWGFEQWQKRGNPAPAQSASRQHDANPPPVGKPDRRNTRGARYETHTGCTLVQDRGNDGDSFKVRLSGNRVEIFRLYFVDTPEGAFRRYGKGETNHARIRDQAADLGNITPEQAVEIGQTAKHFTLGLLGAAPFTLHTAWDSPYNDRRYHAFIEVKSGGRTRLLHELLVERGLCRIRTKPADLPDGTSADEQKATLRRKEGDAKRAAAGAWGL